MLRRIFEEPNRDYLLIALVLVVLALDSILPDFRIGFWIILACALPVALRSMKSIMQGRISIDTFNMFAIAAAALFSDARSLGFIVLMLASADALEWHTVSRSKKAVAALFALQPDTARVVRSGRAFEEVSVSSLKPGDECVVFGGERIPADGVIVEGLTYVNQAVITGESAPVGRGVNDAVFALSINEGNPVRIRISSVGKDSTAERIASLIADAARNKSQPERLADRFAALFLPLVLILGICTYLITKDVAMTAALFLIACADDMSVAIPLAVAAATGDAARHGIIVKGGERLSLLSKMNTLILDKTGTLTYGKPSVISANLAEAVAEEYFWRIVGTAERYSEHPIGKAITAHAESRSSITGFPETYEVVKGMGIAARVENVAVLVGSREFLTERGVAVPAAEAQGTAAYVSFDGTYAGAIALGDGPRPEAKRALLELRSLGISRIIMLTGDNAHAAAPIGEALGIDDIRAGLDPAGKLAALEEIMAGGGIVAMVGDGVNDAPVLSRADIGIAMGKGGTAIASEAADVILMTDDLLMLPDAIRRARSALAVIRSDAYIWGLTNVVGFLLVFTGVVGPALAAFYNFITDFFPLANSFRLFRRKTAQ